MTEPELPYAPSDYRWEVEQVDENSSRVVSGALRHGAAEETRQALSQMQQVRPDVAELLGEEVERLRQERDRYAEAHAAELLRVEQAERERDEARAGADETLCDLNAVPTPGQWVAAFLDGGAERRLAIAGRSIADADVAGRCFVENHRKRLREQPVCCTVAQPCEQAGLAAGLRPDGRPHLGSATGVNEPPSRGQVSRDLHREEVTEQVACGCSVEVVLDVLIERGWIQIRDDEGGQE